MIFKWHLGALLLLATPFAEAIGVSPTRIVFQDTGTRSHEVLITGDKVSPLAIEIYLQARGKLDLTSKTQSNDKCLSISLPQAYLEVNQSLTVWIKHNKEACQTGSAYIVVETLPIKIPQANDPRQLSISSRFLVPLHINPAPPQSLIANVSDDHKTVSITNPEPRPILFSALSLEVQAGKEWVRIPGSRLAQLVRSDAILADTTVRIEVNAFLPGANYRDVRVIPVPITSNTGG